ncbi:MAG: DUF4157 domain-containing protein [Bacteroidota bacterium]
MSQANKTSKPPISTRRAQPPSTKGRLVEDVSPLTQLQKKWQGMAEKNPHVLQMKTYQDMADQQPDQPLTQARANNTGLPDSLKSGIESLSGYSMDDVRVHYNSARPAQLHAHAFAQGSDIHLGPGQEKHLPHEAWHVVQQKQGRVKATVQLKGLAGNDDKGLEREADRMGLKSVQLGNSPATMKRDPLIESRRHFRVNRPVIQRISVKGRGVISGIVTYTKKTNNGELSAYQMKARNLKLKNRGTRRLAPNNEPSRTVSPPGWTALKRLGLTKKAPSYKRMHLLNGKLGGTGTDEKNLAPGSSRLNTRHSKKVEEILQKHILKGGTVTEYFVSLKYRNKKTAKMKSALEDTYKYTLQSLSFYYKLSGSNAVIAGTLKETPNTAKAWGKLK